MHEAQFAALDTTSRDLSRNRTQRKTSLTFQRSIKNVVPPESLQSFNDKEDDYSIDELLALVNEDDLEIFDNDAPSTFKKIHGRSDSDSWMHSIDAEMIQSMSIKFCNW